MTFPEICQEFGIPTAPVGHDHHRIGWINVDGPCCAQVGHYRLGYNLRGRYFYCWACSWQNPKEVLQALTNLPWSEVKKLLNDLPRENNLAPARRGKLVIPDGVGPLRPAHKRYLREERNLYVEEMESIWRLQGIGIAARLAWRLFIPFYHQGRVVSWLTRGLTDEGLRYISAAPSEEELNHKHLLFGEDLARAAITIHEGPLDVFAVGPGAVATCGTAYSKAQLLRMTKFSHRYVVYDNEPAAQARAKKLCDELVPFPGVTKNIVLDAKDASASTKRELKQLRRLLL